jgi:D-threo-aldose 1-dehydrogenase
MEMKIAKRSLGKTSIKVTEIAFGGTAIGNLYQSMNNHDCQETIQAAWDAGIRYFDTAPQYGHGLSEHRLGHILKEYQREDFILSSKVGEVFTPSQGKVQPDEVWFVNPLPFESKQEFSYDAIMRGVEHSLHRLSTNVIDILHVHDLDHKSLGSGFEDHFQTMMHSGYRALHELREQGVIKAISMGVKEWEVCERALSYGEFDCFMLQGSYTLLEQPAKEFLDSCITRQISIIQAGPFSSGILVKGPVDGAHHHHTKAQQEVISKVKKIQRICQDFKVPMPAVAIQFPLSHPAIASVAIGMRSPHHVSTNLQWYATDIPSELWEELRNAKVIT